MVTAPRIKEVIKILFPIFNNPLNKEYLNRNFEL